MNKIVLVITSGISGLVLMGCASNGYYHDHPEVTHCHYKECLVIKHHHHKRWHPAYRMPADYDAKTMWYPYSYFGTKRAAQARMSQQGVYAEGYEAGCRTAWTGGMYKNAKLLSFNQSYQMGWETGFNQCRYDRGNIDYNQQPKFSYIPY